MIDLKNFIQRIIKKDLSSKKYFSIRTRFPPEPNGCLHIGHAKSIFLNFEIAKYFSGNCNLRFEDTNPEKEDPKYVELIKKDIRWLGYKWDGKIHYVSDYFEQLYNFAIELIKKGLAYVDQLSIEEIKKYRGTKFLSGKESPYRNRTIEENLFLFKKMRKGEFPVGKACLRAKIDMNSPMLIMRDPVIYRIKFVKHQRTKNNWCIYPTYDFTHCISDIIEGVTHSLCTIEFQENRKLYDWILSNIDFDKKKPKQYEFFPLNIKYTVMSKRKLKLLVNKNFVEGWDDPRMPTISGLRRRGYTASSILDFCNRIGFSKKNSLIDIKLLESCIRRDLERKAIRAMAVIDPIKIIIESLPTGYEEEFIIKKHPKFKEMGCKTLKFNKEIYIDRNDFSEKNIPNYKRLILGGKVKLRHAYIIKAKRLKKDKNGKITTVFCCHEPKFLSEKTKNSKTKNGIIHWVSATYGILSEFRIYDKLFKEENPEKSQNLINSFNKNSLSKFIGFVEPNILSEDTNFFQFERIGYFCIDKKSSTDNLPVFNCIVKLKKEGNLF